MSGNFQHVSRRDVSVSVAGDQTGARTTNRWARDDRLTTRSCYLLTGALFLLAWFAPLGWRDLITPDEGRYAELALGMFRSGDWITPRLNGILYFEKPPLQYWMTALAYHAFGVNEFSARLWPALCGAAGVVVVGWGGTRLYGVSAGVLAAAVLGSATFWVGNSHFLTLDAGLSFFLSAAMVVFLVAQDDRATPRARLYLMLVVWAAMALAMLSKGLIALVIPGGAIALYLVRTRDWSLLSRLQLRAGLIVFLVIASPWFIAATLENPEFARSFFVHEHFARFVNPGHGRTAPWWYFLVLLPLGMLPWTPWLAQIVRTGWRRTPGRFQSSLFLLCWCVFVVTFFSLSSSKLPSYILPAFPALALLTGRALADPSRKTPRRSTVALAVAAFVVASAAPFLPRFYHGGAVSADAHQTFALWVAAGLVVLVIAIVAGLGLMRS